MKSYHKLMTAFWLLVTIVGILVAAYFIYMEGWKSGSMYLVFPLLSGMMYGMRKFMLARMKRQDKN